MQWQWHLQWCNGALRAYFCIRRRWPPIKKFRKQNTRQDELPRTAAAAVAAVATGILSEKMINYCRCHHPSARDNSATSGQSIEWHFPLRPAATPTYCHFHFHWHFPIHFLAVSWPITLHRIKFLSKHNQKHTNEWWIMRWRRRRTCVLIASQSMEKCTSFICLLNSVECCIVFIAIATLSETWHMGMKMIIRDSCVHYSTICYACVGSALHYIGFDMLYAAMSCRREWNEALDMLSFASLWSSFFLFIKNFLFIVGWCKRNNKQKRIAQPYVVLRLYILLLYCKLLQHFTVF